MGPYPGAVHEPVSLAIIGAGVRGEVYASFALHQPHRARVVAVADPRTVQRDRLADRHCLDPTSTFDDWRQLADQPRLADAAIIAAPDAIHAEAATALAERGYHLLLEKPMATTPADCRAVVETARRCGVILGICHVLRHTPYTRAVKQLLEGGSIGELIGIDRLEPIGWWHFAHAYVRGNWRREDHSSFSLLAKCCHDLDWLLHVAAVPWRRVSSFGGLRHFRPENKPADAGDAERCCDCSYEPDCPYSAVRLYHRFVSGGAASWPSSVITDEPTPVGIDRALRDGPYGRCVYACDNDVCDHQVVTIELDAGITATLTMAAFTAVKPRRTRLYGSHGSIEGDGQRLELVDFVRDRREVIDTRRQIPGQAGHGGGDHYLVDDFVDAVARGEPGRLPPPAEALEAHLLAFAAERARREQRVVGREQPG